MLSKFFLVLYAQIVFVLSQDIEDPSDAEF